MADAITLITRDHREMEQLFDRLEKERGQRPRLLAEVAALLIAHSRAEEVEVYPAIAKEADERDEVHHGVDEHREAEKLLHKLQGTDPSSPEFDGALREFVDAVKHHVEEEEMELLSALKDAVDAQRLEQLGDGFAARRAEELERLRTGAGAAVERERTP